MIKLEEFVKEYNLSEKDLHNLSSEIKMSCLEFFQICISVVKFARSDTTKSLNEAEVVSTCLNWNYEMAKKRGK